jgi:hypothetical protein
MKLINYMPNLFSVHFQTKEEMEPQKIVIFLQSIWGNLHFLLNYFKTILKFFYVQLKTKITFQIKQYGGKIRFF